MENWKQLAALLLVGWSTWAMALAAPPAQGGGDDPAKWSRKRFKQEAARARQALDSYATIEAGYDQMDTLQAAISQGLMQLLQCRHSLGPDMQMVLQAPGIMVGESSDRMLRTLALYERNGGSDEHYISLLQFHKDARHPWAMSMGDAPAEVVPVNTISQTYLAIQTRKTCSTCYEATATVLSFGTDSCLETPVWSWSGQGLAPEFSFDPETKSFTYTYVVARAAETEPEDPSMPAPMVLMRHTGAYIWTGHDFDFVEEFVEETTPEE